VHYVTAPVVVEAAHDDKVAPSLSPSSSSSNVREDGVDGVPPNAVSIVVLEAVQGAGDDGKLPHSTSEPPWLSSCLRRFGNDGVLGAHVAAHVVIEDIRTRIGVTAPAHRHSFIVVVAGGTRGRGPCGPSC
jgi:hypothetical protein